LKHFSQAILAPSITGALHLATVTYHFLFPRALARGVLADILSKSM